MSIPTQQTIDITGPLTPQSGQEPLQGTPMVGTPLRVHQHGIGSLKDVPAIPVHFQPVLPSLTLVENDNNNSTAAYQVDLNNNNNNQNQSLPEMNPSFTPIISSTRKTQIAPGSRQTTPQVNTVPQNSSTVTLPILK